MRRMLSLLAVLVVICSVAPSWAEEAGPGGTEAEARALFEEAAERIRSGRFAEARDLLERSLDMAPNPATVFNLAVACRGTGEVLRAIELLDALLEDGYETLSPTQRAEAEELRRAVRSEVGVVVVTASGAPRIVVRVDGRRVGSIPDGGQLEWRVDPGRRLIAVSATDRVPSERRVLVERGGRVRLRFSLSPTEAAKVGRLIVEAANPDHQVEIVGVARGRGRLERAVPPGDYRVRVAAPEGSRETRLTVRPRSTVRYQFEAPSSSIFESPIFWASTAGVVAAVTIGIVLVVLPSDKEPVGDPVYGIVEALRRAE